MSSGGCCGIVLVPSSSSFSEPLFCFEGADETKRVYIAEAERREMEIHLFRTENQN